jgi:site-specific DNA-methyltransferase (cytosine-N4-specific)|tara:strand:- start:126 stop:929 length:804 start_codon:yes stop_codon:yes gene_type:complete
MEKNIFYHKSSEKMKEVDDSSIRLIVTSPPYFNAKDYDNKKQIGQRTKTYDGYIQSMINVWKECFRILKPNGKLCINTPILPMEKAVLNTHYNRDYLNINNDIEKTILSETEFFRYGLTIWDKGSTDQLMMGSYPYPPNFYQLNTIEFINIFVKDGKPEKISDKIKKKSILEKSEWREYINSIWKIAPEKKRNHPAPFPKEIPLRLIKLFSFYGDTIVDPFMGSGTTAVVANQMNRNFVGYEINSQYIKMSKKRLNEENGGLEKLWA